MLDLAPDQRRLQNHLRAKAGLEPIPDPETMLHCGRCNQWKPDEEFYRSSGKPIRRGRQTFCKPCNNSDRRAWREANRERENASLRMWRRKNKHVLLRDPVDCPGCGEVFDLRGLPCHQKRCPGLQHGQEPSLTRTAGV